MSSRQLPLDPSLTQLKHQAKDLRNAHRSGSGDIAIRIRASFPKFSDASETEILGSRFSLQDAQMVIAREYGFSSWSRLKRHVESLRNEEERTMSDALQQFIDAVNQGDAEAAKAVLAAHEEVRNQIDTPQFGFDTPAIVQSRNNRAMVDVLLEFGADINVKSQWEHGGQGVLHGATPEMAEYLISRGADIDIHAAAKFDMMDLVQDMVAADPAVVDAKGLDGQRPLHFASTPEMVDYLLEHGADINARCDDHQATPAQYAANDPVRCRYLIERGAEPDIFMACAIGDTDMARSIIADRPDSVDAHTPWGFAAHEDGVGYDHPPTPEDTSAHIYLWTLGLNVTPHMVALKFERPDVHALLLEHSSPLRQLIDACVRGEGEAEERILVANPGLERSVSNADAGVLCGRGLYEYYDASQSEAAKAVRTMVDAGFPLTIRAEMGATPLHWASWYGNHDAVRVLLDYSAPLEIHDEVVKSTPLQWATHGAIHGHHSYGGHMAIIRDLLAAGADADAVSVPTGNREIDAMVGAYQNR